MQAAWEVAAHWQKDLPGGGEALQGEGPLSTAVIAALSFWDYSLVRTSGARLPFRDKHLSLRHLVVPGVRGGGGGMKIGNLGITLREG